jgi:preprotein translocase subunit SecE
MSVNWSKELDAKAEFAEYFPEPEAELAEGPRWSIAQLAINATVSVIVFALLLSGIIWLAESIEGWLR